MSRNRALDNAADVSTVAGAEAPSDNGVSLYCFDSSKQLFFTNLVYGLLALAASSGDLLLGGTMMICFGVGTAPVMILTGCGGSLLNLTARKHLDRVAAWCVVLTGLI